MKEREVLYRVNRKGSSKSEIVEILGRHRTTIYRELALESDDLSFIAMGSDPNGTIVFHDGGDEGSPGTFTSFTMEDADFNGDGFVNGLDFLKWQRGETPGGESQAELALWEAQYGTAVTLSAVSSAVPEPRTLLLMLAGLAGMVSRQRL